jgi:hypothetical protein
VPFFSFFEISLGESLYLFTPQLFFLKEMGVVLDLKKLLAKIVGRAPFFLNRRKSNTKGGRTRIE